MGRLTSLTDVLQIMTWHFQAERVLAESLLVLLHVNVSYNVAGKRCLPRCDIQFFLVRHVAQVAVVKECSLLVLFTLFEYALMSSDDCRQEPV